MSLPHAVGEEEPTLPIRRVSTVPPPEHGTIVFDLTRSMEWLRRAGGAMGGASSSFVESPVLTETLLHGSHTSHASGTFMGVFVPCTCTIFGVVVFLRLGVVVGQAGIWCTLLVLLFAFGLTLLTTLSICALISDGTDIASSAPIGKGATDPGVYAALRKSVGKSLGTALGAAFYLAFMTNVAFYIVGFAETMRQALRAHSSEQAGEPCLPASLIFFPPSIFHAAPPSLLFALPFFLRPTLLLVSPPTRNSTFSCARVCPSVRPSVCPSFARSLSLVDLPPSDRQIFPWNPPGTWIDESFGFGALVFLAVRSQPPISSQHRP